MKNAIVLIVLILTLFTSSQWAQAPLSPSTRFGGDHLLLPDQIIASKGEIYIRESKMYRIVIFSTTGKFEMNLGRDGEAPSEFKALNIININDGKIYCYDWMGRRIHQFSQKDKKYLGFIPFINILSGLPPHKMIFHSDGTLIMLNNGLFKNDTLISLYTPDGKLIKRFFNAYPAYQNMSEFEKDTVRNGHSNVDCKKNSGFIGLSNGKLYFANIIENQLIEMDMNGEILNRFIIPLPSHEKTLKFITISNTAGRVISAMENQLTYDLKSVNNTIYFLCRDNDISYIFKLDKGSIHEVCRMKEALSMFDIIENKIYCLEAETSDEDKGYEVLVYDLPKN